MWNTPCWLLNSGHGTSTYEIRGSATKHTTTPVVVCTTNADGKVLNELRRNAYQAYQGITICVEGRDEPLTLRRGGETSRVGLSLYQHQTERRNLCG